MSATGRWNECVRFRTIGSETKAMLVKSVEVCVVEGAYEIAANYFKATGRMPHDVDFHQPFHCKRLPGGTQK
jgi:hypothetical protein